MRYIPRELVHIILDYDGKIKYRRGEYINIIHKHDDRYNVITPIINKKLAIVKNIELDEQDGGFYFEFMFDSLSVSLCYDYNFTYRDTFEICYVDLRNGYNDSCQIRSYL
jgi:hypothetical protein